MEDKRGLLKQQIVLKVFVAYLLCPTKMFILIRGNVCMLHGPIFIFYKKSRPTLTSIRPFDSLIWCSVRQSYMMYFIAPTQNKTVIKGSQCNGFAFLLLNYFHKMNEYLVSCGFIVFNALARRLFLRDWARGKRQSLGPIISETNDSANHSVLSFDSAVSFKDHSVFPRALRLIELLHCEVSGIRLLPFPGIDMKLTHKMQTAKT